MVTPAGAMVLGGSAESFDAWEAQLANSQRGVVSPGAESLPVESAAIALEKLVGPDGRQLFPGAYDDMVGDRDYEPSWTELDAGSDLAFELSGQALSQLGAAGVVVVAQGCAKMIAHYEARLAEAGRVGAASGVRAVREPGRGARRAQGGRLGGVAGAGLDAVARGRTGGRGGGVGRSPTHRRCSKRGVAMARARQDGTDDVRAPIARRSNPFRGSGPRELS